MRCDSDAGESDTVRFESRKRARQCLEEHDLDAVIGPMRDPIRSQINRAHGFPGTTALGTALGDENYVPTETRSAVGPVLWIRAAADLYVQGNPRLMKLDIPRLYCDGHGTGIQECRPCDVSAVSKESCPAALVNWHRRRIAAEVVIGAYAVIQIGQLRMTHATQKHKG